MRKVDLLGRQSAILSPLRLLFAILILVPSLYACGIGNITTSTERGNYYFRLKTQYSHNNVPIDFNIVVACRIRVDRYRGGNSGFLAIRYPVFFFKRTHDNHEIMQPVPSACRGETTTNGRVPKDLLPGVVWFDKPGDYRFGIAYVSEDAFENSASQLKFHGASIERASRREWEAFQKEASDNEGMRSRYYDLPLKGSVKHWKRINEPLWIAKSKGRQMEGTQARACTGYTRLKLSEPARAVLRKHWPANKPKYWAPSKAVHSFLPELKELEKNNVRIAADGFPYIQRMLNYQYNGLPTRKGGGAIASSPAGRWVASEIYPSRTDEGIPWVFNEDIANSPYLTIDLEIQNGPGKGFLYCYSKVHVPNLHIPLPDFRSRERRVRVDGERVETPEPRSPFWRPTFFYEKDEYIYRSFHIGFS